MQAENLEELLESIRNRDRYLAPLRACRIARSVTAGLEELHRLSVIHLDIKPANVMIGHEDGGEDLAKFVDLTEW